MQRGRLGRIRNVYVTFPGTCSEGNWPAEPVPDTVDWDLWLGPVPWRPFNNLFHHVGKPRHVVPWQICPDFGGGNLTSNAVHAFDVVQWGLGMDASGPVEITPPETGECPYLTYKYADGAVLQVTLKLDPKVHAIPPGWDPNTGLQVFGALFVGDDGWIHVGRQGFLEAYPAGSAGGTRRQRTAKHTVTNHHLDWLASHPQPPAAVLRCGEGLPLHDGLPPRLHRALDGPQTAVESRKRRIHRRRDANSSPNRDHGCCRRGRT